MPGSPIRRTRRGGIRLADGTVIAFPKLTHPRAGLSHAQWRPCRPWIRSSGNSALSLDEICEIICRPWEECDAAWLAIKTRVLSVFWAIGAEMIRAAIDGTVDLRGCVRARPAA
jgi:hypothetical protein